MDLTGYQPLIVDKYLHIAQDGFPAVNRRYVGRFGMAPKIIVIHIQEGNNWGSWQHFHSVTASATVLIGKNGAIWRLVPESDSPWTNGDVKSPTARAREFINKWGADPNVYSLTIETEGYTGEWPKPEAQLKSVLWQVLDWKKKYNIDDVYVVRHAEINAVDRPYCPGNAFYAWLVEQLNSQSQTPPVVEPKYGEKRPIIVNGQPWDGSKDVTINGAQFNADKREVVTNKEGEVHQYATFKSLPTRGNIPSGYEFNVLGWCRGEKRDGEDRWWITKNFSRIHVGCTVDKPEDGMDTPPEALPGGAIIVKGVVYYLAKKEDEYKNLIVTRKANLRKGNNLKSKVVGTVVKGNHVEAEYWCFGEEVNRESIWWVLFDPRGSIDHGARLWVAATNSRPE